MSRKSIYLDVCALSRPFDDQGYLRIKQETDAVNMILAKVKQGKYGLLFSSVHIKEIEAYDNILERVELQTILKKLGEQMNINLSETRARAEELVNLGFGVADAAHVAFAERAGALFISCDNKLIKKCLKHNIKVWCGNPVAFCEKENLR
ncbi:MAG: hypothetical protein WC556_14720 [Candidatus Methanoperedens sp.]